MGVRSLVVLGCLTFRRIDNVCELGEWDERRCELDVGCMLFNIEEHNHNNGSNASLMMLPPFLCEYTQR